MSEITAASHEQSTGIAEVNQAIAQMDEMTQQNAALVEQVAAAAESMQDQAALLAQVVSVFKLEGSSLVAASPNVAVSKASIAPVRPPTTKRYVKPVQVVRAPEHSTSSIAVSKPSRKTTETSGDDWEAF